MHLCLTVTHTHAATHTHTMIHNTLLSLNQQSRIFTCAAGEPIIGVNTCFHHDCCFKIKNNFVFGLGVAVTRNKKSSVLARENATQPSGLPFTQTQHLRTSQYPPPNHGKVMMGITVGFFKHGQIRFSIARRNHKRADFVENHWRPLGRLVSPTALVPWKTKDVSYAHGNQGCRNAQTPLLQH